MTEFHNPNFSGSTQTSQPTLKSLYTSHIGKGSDKWSSYFEFYDRTFRDLRQHPVRILEIGVQNGGSLEIWLRYFPNAQIVIGCDIDEKCRELKYDDPRIKIIIGDINDEPVRHGISELSEKFDIIIDDGSHHSSDVIRTFSHYFEHLADGGLYVVEDLHTSYWPDYGGHLNEPQSSLSFFKRLIDIINAEHWDTDRLRDRLFEDFAKRYAIRFDNLDFAAIHGVSFRNSLCVIEKAAACKNSLGGRFVAGQHFKVGPNISELSGTQSQIPDNRGTAGISSEDRR